MANKDRLCICLSWLFFLGGGGGGGSEEGGGLLCSLVGCLRGGMAEDSSLFPLQLCRCLAVSMETTQNGRQAWQIESLQLNCHSRYF